jgi:large subunit ribosomal protein L25
MPKAAGGAVLDQPLHTLHVECSPVRIPEAIRLDLTTLALGSPVHVRDVTFPEGVKPLDPPEAVIVQLKLPGAEPTAPVATEPGVGPEVIKKEKKEEEEE